MSTYLFSVISIDKDANLDIRCLKCAYLFKGLGEKYMNKIVSRIVLPITSSVSKIMKEELTPAPLLPGMKGGPYTTTFGTLPCSIKDKIVNLLFADYEGELGHFTDCANKKCEKFTETWKMYNLFYNDKRFTRIYRKEVYSAELISNEIRKVIENHNKYYSNNPIPLSQVVVKTESGEDITDILFPNLFTTSSLDFLDDFHV
jgi:hypothetical protein